MARLKFLVRHWEKDVDAGTSPEASVKIQTPFGEGKPWYLHWASFVADYNEETLGSSVEANLLFNETNLKTAVPGIGSPSDQPIQGERVIHRFIAENLGGGGSDFAMTNIFKPPEPIKFDENDYLGIWFNFVNKGGAAARFGCTVILAVAEDKYIE